MPFDALRTRECRALATGNAPTTAAVNPVTNKIYVAKGPLAGISCFVGVVFLIGGLGIETRAGTSEQPR